MHFQHARNFTHQMWIGCACAEWFRHRIATNTVSAIFDAIIIYTYSFERMEYGMRKRTSGVLFYFFLLLLHANSFIIVLNSII